MRYWTAQLERADALLFGRVTYEMMESAWRKPATGTWPDWMDEWQIPFAETIDRANKYVVSSTLSRVDWNAELVRDDLGHAVQRLKQEPGDGLWVGGGTLPLALADLGLIDEYEFLVQPVLAGHGPTLLAGLRERIQLELVDRHEFQSGAVACGTGPRKFLLEVACPGTLAAPSRRKDGSGSPCRARAVPPSAETYRRETSPRSAER
jgi:dihydrofolate reductase